MFSRGIEGKQMLKKKRKVPASIRDWAHKYLPSLIVINKIMSLIFSKRSFLRKSGYIKSVALRRPCKADGSPIPWMNYNMVTFLEQRLTKDLSLFEYGSGNSTLFFAALVRDVVSVEHNKKWYDYFSGHKPQNAHLIFCEPNESERYSRVIEEQGKKFDVVIVDGEDRINCMTYAREFLTPTGVIILDDTQGMTTKAGIENLLKHGFRRLDFEGLKAGSVRFYRTTILYRDGNCFGI
jgi:hypothetical protein